MRWTTGQDAILREYGSLGAKKCAQIIRRKTGVKRSVHAVQNRASRIGVSLFEHSTCPGCGRFVKKLRQTGFCDICQERRGSEPKLIQSRVMRSMQVTQEDQYQLRNAIRDGNRYRKRNSRE